MSKKNLTAIDFDFGIGQIIPSTQESYHHNEADMTVRKEEKTGHGIFKERLLNDLTPHIKNNAQFPTNKEVFVFILQYFIAEKEYARRDIDNMAKTILDVLKGKFYTDDSQVKTLLVGKKIEHKISQNLS